MLKLLKPSLLIVTAFVIGGAWFKMSTPDTCPAIASDAKIFVLTGDARRIPFAADLLDGHPSRRLYIIGVGGYDYPYLTPGELRHQIKIENESKTTAENAIAIRDIVREQNIRRIVLVTTQDHMKRSELLIRRQLPDVKIIECPVPLHGTDAALRLERWTLEYMKYIGTMLGVESKK
ncbi:MAG: YdcF family protein [Alphaproteobacteria bacterium]|nr:YdcF family protein [Alphaproteobacteria bacterium]MCL2889972.1 YdcF family protein [Alphaproteobacteria bacterium]